MSLFTMIKSNVAELLTGANDKGSELTGIDLPGGENADQLIQSANDLTDTGQNLAGTVGDTATESVTDAIAPRARE